MIAHVICCNDFPEAVALGDKPFAEATMKSLKEADFQNNVSGLGLTEAIAKAKVLHWHIRTVKVYKPPRR